MINLSPRHLCVAVLLLSLIAPYAVSAQESPEATPTDVEADVEADVKTEVEKEAVEASSDLRDAVNENLGSIQEDLERSDEAKKVQEQQDASELQQPDDVVSEEEVIPDSTISTPGEQKETEKPPEKNLILDRLQSIPKYLQSVPDRVPYLRDRGIIFFGRAELDYAYYSSGSASSDSGFRIRSLRAGLANTYKYNLSAKAEVDLTDGDSNFADLYVRYNNKHYGLFTIGNQRVAQTLVNQTSRISRTYMEEPLPAEAFGLGRRLAIGWDLHKTKGGLHLTAFGPDLNGSIGDSGYAGRIYFNPTRSKLNVFHVGASVVSENMSRKTRFFSHPESRVTDKRFIDTGIFDDITQQRIYALEVAGAWDSYMFRGEFFHATWERKLFNNPSFNGFYLQASKALTGETYRYIQGKFLRIRPQKTRGAWEVAIRASKVDLNDRSIHGGEERNLSFAVNWYAPGNQFRMMCNVIAVKTDKFAGNESPTIFQLRAQFHW